MGGYASERVMQLQKRSHSLGKTPKKTMSLGIAAKEGGSQSGEYVRSRGSSAQARKPTTKLTHEGLGRSTPGSREILCLAGRMIRP